MHTVYQHAPFTNTHTNAHRLKQGSAHTHACTHTQTRTYMHTHICRVGQNRIYTYVCTIYLVIFKPEIPYVRRMYMVLANPTYLYTHIHTQHKPKNTSHTARACSTSPQSCQRHIQGHHAQNASSTSTSTSTTTTTGSLTHTLCSPHPCEA